MGFDKNVVLGSQSPQRQMLLNQVIESDKIIICPPANSEEAGFQDLNDRTAISSRLAEITRTKNEDVFAQCAETPQIDLSSAIILTADTTIIAGDKERSTVLGKPDGPNWQQTVRDWFMEYYSGMSHEVVSGVCLRMPDETIQQFECSTTVKFKEVSSEMLEWYLSTEEPLGKAGGYGIQSAGSIFVESIHGSLSNVIGLPLEVVVEQILD